MRLMIAYFHGSELCIHGSEVYTAHYTTLYHGLAIYTEVTFVNVTLLEAGPSGGGPAVA